MAEQEEQVPRVTFFVVGEKAALAASDSEGAKSAREDKKYRDPVKQLVTGATRPSITRVARGTRCSVPCSAKLL